jgi:hypothetical protein
MTLAIAILLAFVTGVCVGAGGVFWWVANDRTETDRIMVGWFKDTEVWAERQTKYGMWRLWLENEGLRAQLRDPFHLGNPSRWISLKEATEVALRCGTVQKRTNA